MWILSLRAGEVCYKPLVLSIMVPGLGYNWVCPYLALIKDRANMQTIRSRVEQEQMLRFQV